MDKAFFENLQKTFEDAKELGVADTKSEMLIKDFLKVMMSEINKKQDQIQLLSGEISSMKKMFSLWNNLLANHIRVEKKNIADQDKLDSMLEDNEIDG